MSTISVALKPPLCVLALPLALLMVAVLPCSAQTAYSTTAAVPQVKRTTIKNEIHALGFGGSVVLVGAPAGSISIEGWKQSKVEITAEIEIQGATDADLVLLEKVDGFVVQEEMNSISILTTGTHDKAFMKRAGKGFPKRLLGLPWKIDFKIKVPQLCDLDITGGKGPFSIAGVDGAILFTAAESDATLNLGGGDVHVTLGAGSATLNVSTHSWRGRGIDIQLAVGQMKLILPDEFNAYINADVVRGGQIENTYAGLKPLERTHPTPQSFTGKAGTGGATMNLKVGQGTLKITAAEQ
jgi:hypothetical protein